MHLLVVLPRRSAIDRGIPNSVDLCVHDLLRASLYRAATCIVAERVHDLFDGFAMADVPRFEAAHTGLLVRRAARLARSRGARLVVVHQHFQVAAGLARALPGRVVFHAHGFYKSYPPSGLIASIRRRARLREIVRLAGMVHVSESCREHFARSWPEVSIPQAIVHNGLDFGSWRPLRRRKQEIVCVGRCLPEKGIREAAQAVLSILPERPGWRARFVLSESERHPEYTQQVRELLTRPEIRNRIDIELNVPWHGVVERYERAAIALVPSRWREPFGRTALEAHAGGAALISSGTGGLREASGPHALFVDPADRDAFTGALQRLIDDDSLREALASGGASYVRDRFSIEAVAAVNDTFYEGLLARERLAPPGRGCTQA
ncbi:MAG: glycosyltransferase family 4 protein [Hyphomicrobiaceae bacterium]|nr:glycosyltransferase family 4 protein [Hyphomicrobiaceae bacterium]